MERRRRRLRVETQNRSAKVECQSWKMMGGSAKTPGGASTGLVTLPFGIGITEGLADFHRRSLSLHSSEVIGILAMLMLTRYLGTRHHEYIHRRLSSLTVRRQQIST